MRKLLPLSILTTALLASCGAPAPDPNIAKEDANKKSFQRLMSAWDSGDSTIFDSLIANNFVDHNPDKRMHSTGRQLWKDMMKAYRGAFPDMKGTPQVIMADADWVMGCATVSGTQTGMMMGKPGCGKAMKDVTGIDVCRFENGKMVEHWGLFDEMTMMTQMGMIGGEMKSDSTSMSMVEMHEHICNPGCKGDKHNYLHGEKGHECSPACPEYKKMDGMKKS